MKGFARLSGVVTLSAVAMLSASSPASAGDLSIGIRIGTPPPPRPAIVVAPQPQPVVVVPQPEPVFVAPQPQPVVIVPQPEPVFVAPEPVLVIESGAPVYFHAGQYFRFFNGAWFVAGGYEGPWLFVPPHRVPPRVLALPHAYSRMHPSHVEVVGPHPWHAQQEHHGHSHWHDGRD